MSATLNLIIDLVSRRDVRVSDHGYDELAADQILATDLVHHIELAVLVEDYPDYPKEPCVLVLQRDDRGNPVHAVWGIPRGESRPAVLITAYRPDPERWSDDFSSRKP